MFTKISDYLRRSYRRVKEEYLGEKSQEIPPDYWSQFVCLGAASDRQYHLGRIIGSGKYHILVVGVF